MSVVQEIPGQPVTAVQRLVKKFRCAVKPAGLKGAVKHLFFPRFTETCTVDNIDFTIHRGEAVGKYPLTLFSKALQYLFATVIPYAFIGFFPAIYLFDKYSRNWVSWCSPFAAVWCVVLTSFVCRQGLKRYESTGN